MIDPILGNLQLRLTNLHIRYEDEGSYPGHRLCLGLLLRKVSAHSVDEAGRKAFVTANALQCLRKVGGVMACVWTPKREVHSITKKHAKVMSKRQNDASK